MLAGLNLDVGVLSFAFDAVLAFIDSAAGRAGVQRPRMTSLLTRWGLAMIVLGPLVLGGGLLWLA